MHHAWNHYHYKNLTLVGISLLIALYLLQNQFFRDILLHLGNWGYLGAFVAGVMFVSTFTASVATVILFILADNNLSHIEIGLIAGLGAVLGDLMIFQFIRNNSFMDELTEIYRTIGGKRLTRLLHSRYFSWTLPVIGAIIIATPFPDELGVSLLGISHMKTWQFVLLSFTLNSIGIFLIISAGVFF